MADTKPTEPLVQITKDGLRVISEEVSERLAKKKLSASTVTGLEGCAAAWLANSFVIPRIIESEPDNAARRGSMFHQVMENFFALPREERTHEAMRREVKKVLASDEYKDLAEIREAVLWLRAAVNGYYNMHADADPSEIVIAEIESISPNGKGTVLGKALDELNSSGDHSKEEIEVVVDSILSSSKYYRLKSNADAVKWIKKNARSYLKEHGNNFESEEAIGARNSLIFTGNRSVDSGLEIFVIGQIGDTKREILGYIDRVQELDREEGADVSSEVMVEDWKSGGKAKHYKPGTKAKNPEGLAEQRQQIIYSMLLEQTKGVKVTKARLIYPVAREIVEVDLTDEKLRERVIKSIEDADAKLDDHIERNLFEYSPGILCSWCSLMRACPAAKRFNHVEKARIAADSQPELDTLAVGFEFTRQR